VGTNGGNTGLVIRSPGAVANVNGRIGLSASSTNNQVRVQDLGATWKHTGSLHLGDQGAANPLLVTNGGNVFPTEIRLGNANSAVGKQATVTGTNSLLTGPGNVWAGYNAPSNSLAISDGATVANNVDSYLGFNSSSSNNTAVVTHPRSAE